MQRMQSLTLKVFRFFLRVILRAKAFEFIRTLEHEIQLEQGKGWGAGSIEVEVDCAINLSKRFRFEIQHFFDVGAYQGEFATELLSRLPIKKAILFEPMKANFEKMKKEVEVNEAVLTLNLAIGNPGEKAIYSENKNSFLGSFYQRSDFAVQELVPVVSGFQIIAEYGSPDFVKIDVEGAELEVLESFRQSLESIKLVQFEFGPPNIESRTFFRDLWEFFQLREWNLFCISRNGPIPVTSYSSQLECFKTTNFLALNSKLIDSFRMHKENLA